MKPKKTDPTSVLVTVIKALEQLVDSDRLWVLSSAANKWSLAVNLSRAGLSGGAIAGSGSPSGTGTTPNSDAQSAIVNKDPRAFMRAKRPETDVQRVACIGYYLAQTTGQPGFSSKDVGAAYTDSGGSTINLTRALDNATRHAKFLSNRGRSQKQLTPLGEDVVEALPDQHAVKELASASKSRGRAGRKKASSRKNQK